MDRTVLFLLFLSVLVAVGFLAGLIFGRPWTRWVTGILVAWFFVLPWFDDPGRILIAVPFVAGLGALGYGAAILGIRLRPGRKPREVRQ